MCSGLPGSCGLGSVAHTVTDRQLQSVTDSHVQCHGQVYGPFEEDEGFARFGFAGAPRRVPCPVWAHPVGPAESVGQRADRGGPARLSTSAAVSVEVPVTDGRIRTPARLGKGTSCPVAENSDCPLTATSSAAWPPRRGNGVLAASLRPT